MAIITVPKPLRETLGEDASEALVKMLNEQGKETQNSVIETAALRFEKRLTEKVSGLQVELEKTEKRLDNRITSEISAVRVELGETEQRLDNRITSETSNVRTELSEKIQKSKTDTIKWMFIFYIGQIGALLGILFAVFK